jgi:hypothetical protein
VGRLRRCTPQVAAAEHGQREMLGFGEVDAAEIAFVEHHTLGSQSAQVVVTETMTGVFAFTQTVSESSRRRPIPQSARKPTRVLLMSSRRSSIVIESPGVACTRR